MPCVPPISHSYSRAALLSLRLPAAGATPRTSIFISAPPTRLENDPPLLRGLLSVYSWLCPKEASKLPKNLWPRLHLPVPSRRAKTPRRNRIKLLDSRAWFGALQSRGKKLEI